MIKETFCYNTDEDVYRENRIEKEHEKLRDLAAEILNQVV